MKPDWKNTSISHFNNWLNRLPRTQQDLLTALRRHHRYDKNKAIQSYIDKLHYSVNPTYDEYGRRIGIIIDHEFTFDNPRAKNYMNAESWSTLGLLPWWERYGTCLLYTSDAADDS